MNFEDAQERMRAAIDSLHALSASLAEQLAEQRSEQERANEETAKLNRSGARGRDWQVLQSRIDLNQTTLNEVLRGEDTSAEAVRVRKLLRGNIDQLNERMDRLTEEDPDEASPRAEAEEMLEQMQQRVRDFQQRFGTV